MHCNFWWLHRYVKKTLKMYSASKSVHSASLFLHFVMLQPKWISIFPSKFYTQHLIMTTQKTFFFFTIKIKTEKSHVFTAFALLMHPLEQLQLQVFLQYEATSLAHLSSWFHPFLSASICCTTKAPSGWMGNIGAQPFSDLSRDVQLDSSLPGPLKDIHRVVVKPLLWYLGCVCLGLLSY